MMLGGGMMLGVGLLMMLLVFVLPILLIVALVGGIFGMAGRQSHPAAPLQSPLPGPNVMPSPQNGAPAQGQLAARFCTHCSAGLQAGWTYCPQCGAPVGQ